MFQVGKKFSFWKLQVIEMTQKFSICILSIFSSVTYPCLPQKNSHETHSVLKRTGKVYYKGALLRKDGSLWPRGHCANLHIWVGFAEECFPIWVIDRLTSVVGTVVVFGLHWKEPPLQQ